MNAAMKWRLTLGSREHSLDPNCKGSPYKTNDIRQKLAIGNGSKQSQDPSLYWNLAFGSLMMQIAIPNTSYSVLKNTTHDLPLS